MSSDHLDFQQHTFTPALFLYSRISQVIALKIGFYGA